MAVKYHVRKRLFLNRAKDMPAYVIGIVEDTSAYDDKDDKFWNYGTIELRISDCVRSVSFDFYMSDRAARADSLYKIRRLASVINEVKDAIEREVESIEQRTERLKKSKGKEEPKAKGKAA